MTANRLQQIRHQTAGRLVRIGKVLIPSNSVRIGTNHSSCPGDSDFVIQTYSALVCVGFQRKDPMRQTRRIRDIVGEDC